MRVQLFPSLKQNESGQLTHENMENIQTDMNLTINQTKKLAKDLRVATKKRNFVESSLSAYLSMKSHKLDDMFTLNNTIFDVPVVHCNSVSQIVDIIQTERMINQEDLQVKIGVGF